MKWATAIDRWSVWMAAAGDSRNTIAERRYQLGRLAQEHPHRSPWRLSTEDLVGWVGGHDWSAETRRSYRSALRSFYAWGVENTHLKRNPAAGLPPVRAPKTLPRPTPDDVLAAAWARATDRDRLILACAAYAGLRRAEIARLRWDQISDTAIRLRGKGGRDRIIPLHPKLRRLLAAEAARREAGRSGTGYRYRAGLDEWVFAGMNGGPITPPALGKIAARALPGEWTAHTLRHRFATRAYALGGRDLLAVQELLGHASTDTTRRYTKTPDGALTAAVNAI